MLVQSRLFDREHLVNELFFVYQHLLVVSKDIKVYLLISQLAVVVLSSKSTYLKNIFKIWESLKNVLNPLLLDTVYLELFVLISILNSIPVIISCFHKIADFTKIDSVIVKKERGRSILVIDFNGGLHHEVYTGGLDTIWDQAPAKLCGVTVLIGKACHDHCDHFAISLETELRIIEKSVELLLKLGQ